MGKAHTPYYPAIDQGGQSSRAILFDSEGKAVDRAQFEVPTRLRKWEGRLHFLAR